MILERHLSDGRRITWQGKHGDIRSWLDDCGRVIPNGIPCVGGVKVHDDNWVGGIKMKKVYVLVKDDSQMIRAYLSKEVAYKVLEDIHKGKYEAVLPHGDYSIAEVEPYRKGE